MSDETTQSGNERTVVSDEQAEAVRQAVIARYRWWFDPGEGERPLGTPEDVTICTTRTATRWSAGRKARMTGPIR